MKKKLTLLSFCLLWSVLCLAQSKPEDIIESFFKEYEVSPRQAIGKIYAANPWTAAIGDAIENLQKEVDRYTPAFVGKYHGKEPITIKKVTPNFIMYSYMVKYDRMPMKFLFTFYKPADKWVLYAFAIEGKLNEELVEASKLQYLNLEPKN